MRGLAARVLIRCEPLDASVTTPGLAFSRRGEGEGRGNVECCGQRPRTFFDFLQNGPILRSMTTIAWDGRTLAADTQSTWRGVRDGHATKIARRGRIFAGSAGNAVICRRLLDWFRAGMIGHPPPAGHKDADSWSTLCIFGLGDLVVTYGPDGWEAVRSGTYALGSGCDFAAGALSAGCDARRAVEIAMLHDTSSGGEITVLTVN